MTPGTKLGPYEILAPIGAGGMGEVYKARDTRLDRIVAIKISKEQFSERFEREAKAVAALNHPNICTLFDVGPNYLVMEYIEGPTLAERIHSGAIPLAEALPIARQIAEALEAAHEKGIVHRDLKPANIKLTPEGKVKVLDFGLAKAFDKDSSSAPDPANSPTLTISATRAGVILGTAGYMSPEQARGHVVDKRADIWSYGVVLFEMLTGRLAFVGETVSDTLAAVLRADLNWSTLPPDTPPAIRRLLRRCLERDRKQRLPDIAVARLEIDEALTGPPESTAPPQAAAPRAWIAATILFALAAAAMAVVHFRQAPPEPAAARLQIPIPPKTTFGAHLSVSPDGRRVIFAASGADTRAQLWVRPLDTLEARPLPGTEDAGYFFWSPDSRFIAFVAGGKLKKVEASGGPPQTICDTGPAILGGAWNRDGVILLGGGIPSGLLRVPASGGMPEPFTRLDPARQETFHAWPLFLPDGKHFLYLAAGNQLENNYIYAATLDAKLGYRDPKRLLATRASVTYAPGPNPDRGHLLFLRDATLMAQPFDAGRLEFTGESFPVAENVGAFLTRGYYAAASNGTIVYRTGGGLGFQLEWFDRQGKSLDTAGPPGNYGDMGLSRDSTRVAVSRSELAIGADLWLVDLVRNISTRFTSQPGSEHNPVWSPDDKWIAYGARDIFRKISSGAGNDELLLHSDGIKRPYDWSGDGKLLLYAATDLKTKLDLWVLPLEGDRKPRPYLQTEFNESQGQFSPDGHWVAYTSDESGRLEVYVQQFPAAGGKWQISSAGGTQPRWRGDGKELFYQGLDRRIMAVELKTAPRFQAAVPQPLFMARSVFTPDPWSFRYAVAPDGKRFLLIGSPQEKEAEAPITVILNWKGNH